MKRASGYKLAKVSTHRHSRSCSQKRRTSAIMSYCPHCTHCEAMTQHKKKAARRQRALEEEGDALVDKLNNEARRRRLDFIREWKKMEKLVEDIESYETRQIEKFKEKKEEAEKELTKEVQSIREEGLK